VITVYGIPNCDKVRAARRWLTDQGFAHRFHDFRADGLGRNRLAGWIERLGLEALINRRSTTWHQLSPAAREIANEDQAASLLLAYPTLIRRPVIEVGDRLVVGIGPRERQALARAIEAGADKG